MVKRTPKYETVDVAKLSHKRRGKHHDLTQEIVKDLEVLPAGKAMKIPLAGVKGVSLINLRAAITRATSSLNLSLGTSTDGVNLFVWKENGNK